MHIDLFVGCYAVFMQVLSWAIWRRYCTGRIPVYNDVTGTTTQIENESTFCMGCALAMWYYYNLAQRTMEIILPEGHIIPPEGCIILPEGRRRPQVEAAQRQDNAPRRWNNVAWGQYNFLWPEGTVVIITFLYRPGLRQWQYCFSLSPVWQPRDNEKQYCHYPAYRRDNTHCPGVRYHCPTPGQWKTVLSLSSLPI